MAVIKKLLLALVCAWPIIGATRKTTYPIDQLFLDRWSARAMSGESISDTELMTLFEAARWAPSSGNAQQWRFVYAKRESKEWPKFLNLLYEGNRSWAQKAAALVVIVSQHALDSGKALSSHSFDTGAAWENLALQGTLNKLVVHGIGGFDHAAAAQLINLPSNYTLQAMVAIGKPGDPASLPENLRSREHPSDRKPLNEIVFEGRFK